MSTARALLTAEAERSELPPVCTAPKPSEVALGNCNLECLSIHADEARRKWIEPRAAGAVVAIVLEDEVPLLKPYGCADTVTGDPVDVRTTLFRIGSVSKLITATAAVHLAETEGLGDRGLDEVLARDIGKSLDFTVPANFAEPITLLNLLTHTSGLEDRQIGNSRSQFDSTVTLGTHLRAHFPARVRPPTRNFESALGAAYSNWNSALLGHIVSVESRLPFDEYVRSKIFDPLGMEHSTFSHPQEPGRPWRDEWKRGLSKGHRLVLGAARTQTTVCPPSSVFEPQQGFEYSLLNPAEGLTTTAADMAKFMRMHLPPKEGEPPATAAWKSVLSRDAIEFMQLPHLGPHQKVPEFNAGNLGFYETHRRARRMVMHSGNTFRFNAAVALMPEERFGVFVAVNTPVGHKPLDNFIKELTNACFEKPVIPPPAQTGSLARYEGSYWSNSRNFTTNEKFLFQFDPKRTIQVRDRGNGTLLVQNLMGNETSWAPVSEHLFRSQVNGNPSQELIAFEVADGKVTHVLGPEAFDPARKLAWHEMPALHERISDLALSFFAAMLAWQAARLARPSARRGEQIAHWLAVGLAASGTIAILVLRRAFSVGEDGTLPELAFGYPDEVLAALGLLMLAVPLMAGVLVSAVLAWQRDYWNRAGRLFYSGFAIVSLLFLWSMNFWNLIGWRLS